MPTKQHLLDTYETCEGMLQYASTNHGVAPALKFIKRLTAGQFSVQVCLIADPEDLFSGSGSDKRDALADCISTRFPG